ncbi:MAG: hypothetical protein KAQ70_01810, partial [Candidatus Heimdallarchaeota archaeon]|nr:hypothetical protein [Candidatus Heimdallarchaeota archaeon]
MNKQLTFLMCSPRGEKSASHSLGSYLTSLFEEKGISVNSFSVYQTLKKQEKIEEMIISINESDIILISSPLYIDQAPYMTIKTMNIITDSFLQGKITKKERYLFAISNAGYLEYYHNNIALKIYEQFAKENEITWAGGLPIGAAGTYAQYPIPEFLKMLEPLPKEDPRYEIYAKPTKLLDSVIRTSVDHLSKGEIVPKEELQKLEFIPMPLEAYIEGGKKGWLEAAEQYGATDKLRDKPYER